MALETTARPILSSVAMPAAAGVVAARLDGLVHLGVGEGLVLALVPSEAAKDAQVGGQLLLGVVAEAVFERAEVFVASDVGAGGVSVPFRKVLDGFAIGAHVGAVGIEEQARRALALAARSCGAARIRRSAPWARLKAQSMSMPLATMGMAKMP